MYSKQNRLMKKDGLFLIAIALLLTGCSKNKDLYDAGAVAQSNAMKLFGALDPNQDWVMMKSGEVTLTADAPLDDIVTVQILTGSPFFNDDAKVLNEKNVTKGQTVKLTYTAATTATQLMAACISSEGVYYVKAFTPGTSSISFSKAAKARRAKASAAEAPALGSIVLSTPHKSLNAMRAEAGDYCTIAGSNYTEWAGSAWKDELMWEVAPNNAPGGEWIVEKGAIYRNINGFEEGEQETVAKIISDFLVKEGSDPGSINNSKRNNLKLIRQSAYFNLNNNYLYTDGETPVTLIPIQANSTEFKLDNVYYYYFKPDATAGMTSEQEADYIKRLPKFKAIPVMQVQASNSVGKVFRNREYLLPFYGDGTPKEGANTASAIFPKGYKIGFLNMKHEDGKYTIANNKAGCTYGDGRLNFEVNHIRGHFNSAVDKELGGGTVNGMSFTDPRIAVFTANNKTYMCFEDGADCTFCDIIVEVGGGTEQLDETPDPEAAAYTMCFEDRFDAADYDMNDVVLQAIRVNATHIQLSVVALGGIDRVRLLGVDGSYLASNELHRFFGIEAGEQFINTESNKQYLNPVSEVFMVDEGVRIEDFLSHISIQNITTGSTVRLAGKGEPPYAIILPINFRYPLEGMNITKAYSNFLQWAKNMNESKNWYELSNAENVFPDMFTK